MALNEDALSFEFLSPICLCYSGQRIHVILHLCNAYLLVRYYSQSTELDCNIYPKLKLNKKAIGLMVQLSAG